jgi:hypothetical protein
MLKITKQNVVGQGKIKINVVDDVTAVSHQITMLYQADGTGRDINRVATYTALSYLAGGRNHRPSNIGNWIGSTINCDYRDIIDSDNQCPQLYPAANNDYDGGQVVNAINNLVLGLVRYNPDNDRYYVNCDLATAKKTLADMSHAYTRLGSVWGIGGAELQSVQRMFFLVNMIIRLGGSAK